VLTELTYQIYRFTGNERVLEDNAEAIARYIAFLKTKLNKNDLISFGLPDWCECGALIESDVSTPLEVTDTLVSIDICQKAEKIFAKIGKTADAQTAHMFARQLKERFREVWLDKDCFVKCNTQTAQAKAIDAGIFTSEEKPKAVENLVSIIRNQGEYFHVGMIGSRVLFRVLADNGYGNLALKMMTRDGFPSYKYWLDLGATSLWESFNEVREGSSIFRKDGGRVLSLNHHFWGDISAWFYKYVLGININPSFEKCNEFELSPIMLDGIDSASGSYIRNGNGIAVNVTRKDGKIFLKVTTFGNAVWKLSDNCESNVTVEN
jgi:alpha-L-rhamnosidase